MGSLHLQEDGYPQETYLQRYSKAQKFEGPWSHELSQALQPQHLWKPGYHHRQPEKSSEYDLRGIKTCSHRGDNWLHFKRAWQIYEQETGISKQEGPVRVAHFLNVIGREGVQLFDTFTFDEDSHESADKIDDVIAKFESRCLPQRNETYER